MSRRIDRENRLIDEAAQAMRFLGCGPDYTGPITREEVRSHHQHFSMPDMPADPDDVWDERVDFVHGFGGDGWYISCGSYPDSGAEFFADYGAVAIARVIVDCEREALREWAGVRS